jgi:hypothetical protein
VLSCLCKGRLCDKLLSKYSRNSWFNSRSQVIVTTATFGVDVSSVKRGGWEDILTFLLTFLQWRSHLSLSTILCQFKHKWYGVCMYMRKSSPLETPALFYYDISIRKITALLTACILSHKDISFSRGIGKSNWSILNYWWFIDDVCTPSSVHTYRHVGCICISMDYMRSWFELSKKIIYITTKIRICNVNLKHLRLVFRQALLLA